MLYSKHLSIVDTIFWNQLPTFHRNLPYHSGHLSIADTFLKNQWCPLLRGSTLHCENPTYKSRTDFECKFLGLVSEGGIDYVSLIFVGHFVYLRIKTLKCIIILVRYRYDGHKRPFITQNYLQFASKPTRFFLTFFFSYYMTIYLFLKDQ